MTRAHALAVLLLGCGPAQAAKRGEVAAQTAKRGEVAASRSRTRDGDVAASPSPRRGEGRGGGSRIATPPPDTGEPVAGARESGGVPHLPAATIVDATPAADGSLVRFTVPGDLAAVWAGWLTALREAGWRILDDHGTNTDRGATYELLDKSRAYLTLARSDTDGVLDGFFRTMPAAPAVQVTGACVAIPHDPFRIVVHSMARGHDGDFGTRDIDWSFDTFRAYDLDGDAILDPIVPLRDKAYCPEDVHYDLYVMRGTCAVRVGTVEGPVTWDLQLAAPDASGFRPVVTESVTTGGGPVPDHTTRRRTFTFDGHAYRKTADESRTGRCHHCATWTCTGPIE